MSELRQDPIVGRWVIVAKERAKRPRAFVAQASSLCAGDVCPFCAGNEVRTPPEVLALRDAGSLPDGPGWRVRAFPNKYPAVNLDSATRENDLGAAEFLRIQQPGVGVHEVIVESPEHVVSTSQLSDTQIAESLAVFQQRLLALQNEARLKHATVFKNVGTAAGATIEHTHSQLLALPLVPPEIAAELDGARRYFEAHGRCVFCDLIDSELADGRRIIADSPDAIAFCPYASRFPFETWIIPKAHDSHFERMHPPTMLLVAGLLRETIARIEAAADRPAYNYYLHTAPFDSQRLDHYHWHIEIVPRMTQVAGFEWATGMFINPVPPEEAAARLRDAMLC